jgi:dTDP-glucose 4,6-dehydratase
MDSIAQRILVTGGCGFIGSNFINYIKSLNPDIFVVTIDKVDYCSNTYDINYDKIVMGNIGDFHLVSSILTDYNIDTVINFAAQTHIDNSFKTPLEFTTDNIVGSHVLIEAVRLYGKIKKFIHISTDEVYGDVSIDHEGCTENDILNPTNPYSASKAGAEHIMKSYCYSYKLPIIIIRCNNVYGNRQYKEKLIPRFIHLLLNNNKCTIHGDGVSRRNFIHINDICNAIVKVLMNGNISEVYNVGCKNEYSVMDIAKILINNLKPNSDINDWIEFVEDRNYNDFRYSINSSKLREIGWEEEVNFDEGILETIDYYKSAFENQDCD